MSIKAMKLALEALENASPAAWASRVDSDTMKSIWRKHAEALEGLRVLLAELDNASCKSVQKRLEAQQPATPEPVTSHTVIKDASDSPLSKRISKLIEMVFHYGKQNLSGVDDEISAISREIAKLESQVTRPAPSVPADVVRDAERYRWLRDPKRIPKISTDDEGDGDGHILVCGHTGEDILWLNRLDAAIDAAMLAAKKASD